MDLSIYKGKKVLITGHTGFKGSWLSRILVQAGADVTGFALEPITEPNLYTILNLSNSMNSVIGDVRDLEALKKVFKESKPEIVFHLAAQPLVRESYVNPVYTYETNVMGTVNVLEALRLSEGVKSFVNITTDKVYENSEWHWGYRENDRLNGFDPYSNSKSCSELVTDSYKKSFFHKEDSTPISTARAGNVIGGGDFSADRIIPDCIKAAGDNEKIIVRNPHSTRPYQHVLECLSGYLVLAKLQYENPMKYCGNYNFGPDDKDCVTTGNLVDIFCETWGNNQGWEDKWDNGPHEASFLKLDCSKAKSELNWKPKWNINKAVKKTIEWAKCYQEKGDIVKCTNNQINEYFV